MKSIGQGGLVTHTHTHTLDSTSSIFGAAGALPNFKDSSADLYGMIAMRMRWPGISPIDHPFHDIYCRRALDKVHVMVIVDPTATPVVISDEWGLFPSDTFVTQLRLLEGK